MLLIDSASTTASVVTETLQTIGARRAGSGSGKLRFLATDGATRFARVGGLFLGHKLELSDVELVDL